MRSWQRASRLSGPGVDYTDMDWGRDLDKQLKLSF